MKNFSKILFILWSIAAVFSLLTFMCDYDVDKLMIAGLEGVLAFGNYVDYKRGV